jgi:hypothetical protein
MGRDRTRLRQTADMATPDHDATTRDGACAKAQGWGQRPSLVVSVTRPLGRMPTWDSHCGLVVEARPRIEPAPAGRACTRANLDGWVAVERPDAASVTGLPTSSTSISRQ